MFINLFFYSFFFDEYNLLSLIFWLEFNSTISQKNSLVKSGCFSHLCNLSIYFFKFSSLFLKGKINQQKIIGVYFLYKIISHLVNLSRYFTQISKKLILSTFNYILIKIELLIATSVFIT